LDSIYLIKLFVTKLDFSVIFLYTIIFPL